MLIFYHLQANQQNKALLESALAATAVACCSALENIIELVDVIGRASFSAASYHAQRPGGVPESLLFRISTARSAADGS